MGLMASGVRDCRCEELEDDRGFMQGPEIDGEVGMFLRTAMAFRYRYRGLMARSKRMGTCSLPRSCSPLSSEHFFSRETADMPYHESANMEQLGNNALSMKAVRLRHSRLEAV